MKVFGEHTMDEDGNVVCKCGVKFMFDMINSTEYATKIVKEYKCQSCGNIILIEIEKDTPRNN